MTILYRFAKTQVSIQFIESNFTNGKIQFSGDRGYILFKNCYLKQSYIKFESDQSPKWSDLKQIEFANIHADETMFGFEQVKSVFWKSFLAFSVFVASVLWN